MQYAPIMAAALAALTSAAYGQGSRIADEGSFTITVSGRTAGRENFRITATTRGEVSEYTARGDVTYGDRKVTPELRTGLQGAIVDYRVTTRSGSTSESWEGAVVARGRLNAKMSSSRGTSAREYVVPADALVLDDEVIHHHWFLAMRSRDGSIPVILPRRSTVQARVTMSTVGEETLQIGTHDLPSVHLRATFPGGEEHEIWIDRSGRLLKVSVPARGLAAVRDDPPPA